MSESTTLTKLKKRKGLSSDSEDNEVLKKHKIVDSDEHTEKEMDSCSKVSDKCAVHSEQLTEGTQNGKYERSVENGLSYSDSAGTDVELTSDEETLRTHQRSKKKRKTSSKSERRSRNNLQVGSSSESEDEDPLSPKSPPSIKKSFRRRRTISEIKTRDKNSTDSESYKTDSESDGEAEKQVSSKDCTPTHKKIRVKQDRNKSQKVKDASSARIVHKNKIEEGSSASENNEPIQRSDSYSSSDTADQANKENELKVSSRNKKCEIITDSKQIIDKGTESSSDEYLDPARAQESEGTERSMKQNSSSDREKVETRPETSEDSEDETARNSDIAKSESMTESSDSEPKIKGKTTIKLDKELEPKEKKLKREESSDDSGSVSNHAKHSAKQTETKEKSVSPSNSAKHNQCQSDSDSSSGIENAKKERQQKKKLPDEDKRIISLKKYLKIAGLRVHNYSDLWKDCRSNKARAQKMLSLLEQNGLKGRPTIEKCKKLRKKIETRREVEELDLMNVMDCGEGRTRRSRLRTSASQELPDEAQQTSSAIRKRLQVFADSDSESE